MRDKNMKRMKNLFASMLLSASLLSAATGAFASTEIFAGGSDGFGASVNDLGGATINYNNGTNAQIGGTGAGNTIKWDYLNVGSGNKLDFNFTQSGQVMLNKVNGGVSKFAGTVSTSGENGHLIISNPNGMVFMDGSVTNVDAGSATFTTHDANWDGKLNGSITTNSNGTANGITIGSGNGPVPVFKVAKDLNIIAPGVDVAGADIFAGGSVRMISSDGVNFLAGANSTPASVSASSVKAGAVRYAKVGNDGSVNYVSGNPDAIRVNNTIVKATSAIGMTDGHLYMVADNNISINDLKAGRLDVTSNQNIAIDNSNVSGNVVATAGKNITVNGLESNTNVRLLANDKIDAKNITAKNGTIWALNAKEVNAKNLTANEVYLGTTTKAVGGGSYSEAWHNEWNPGSQNVVAEDINATLRLNIFSKDKMNVKNLTSGGDMTLGANNIVASDLKVTGQMDRVNAGGNKTIGIMIQKNDDGTTGGTLDVKNIDSAVATTITGFGDAKVANVKSPIFMAESVKNLTIDNLKTDNLYLSALYSNWFGMGGPINATINGLSGLNGDTVKINKVFDASSFDKTIDDARGYQYNMLVLDINDYLNMSFNEKSNLLPVMFDDALTSLTIANSTANIDLGRISSKNGATITTTGDISVLNQITDGNLTLNAGKNVKIDGLTADKNVKFTASDTIDIKNINAKGTVSALNAENIIADTIKGNLVYLGGRTKDKAQPGITIGSAAWYEEWNPSAKSIIANNIEADLDLRLLSTDKIVANGLTSGGDIHLVGNNVNASNINVTDQKIKTHYPSSNTTTGLIAETYDSWASGWGLASNEGKGSILTLNNVNIDDKAAAVQISAFEKVNGKNVTTPTFIAESVGNMNIDGLKTDDIHLSNLYYTLFGNGYFDLESANIKNISAFTQGRDVTLNQSFNPDEFDSNLDKNYGYKHNLLVLQYLNGDYDKVANKAKNTNIAIVNYVDGVKLDGGVINFGGDNGNGGGLNNNDGQKNNESKRTVYADEFYRLHEDIDTVFRRQFQPRSFAASDDEIREMKNEVAKLTVKNESGTIKLHKEFRAY